MPELVHIVLLSIISIIVLFVLTRLMGNRQISQLTMFDYVAGISIGSIAAEMAVKPEPKSWYGLLAMALYAGATILSNWLNSKSRKARSLILGEPLVLLDKGKLYDSSLKKAKLDLTEFLTECRVGGYFDLSQLETVLMEVNGRLSFLPKESARPLTPEDMRLSPQQSRLPIAVVMDGVLLPERLRMSGNTEGWLRHQLELQGYKNTASVLLACVDSQNNLSVYAKTTNPPSPAACG